MTYDPYTEYPMRQLARTLIRGRRLLLARVVVSLRDEGPSQVNTMIGLQSMFEKNAEALPRELFTNEFLERRMSEPAQRMLIRYGVLETGRRLRHEWGFAL